MEDSRPSIGEPRSCRTKPRIFITFSWISVEVALSRYSKGELAIAREEEGSSCWGRVRTNPSP